MFASNFPVDSLCAPFATIFGGFREIVADLAPNEQRALFRDNAIRIYGMTRHDAIAHRLRRRRPDGPADGQAPAARSATACARTTSSPRRTTRRTRPGRPSRARPRTPRAAPTSSCSTCRPPTRWRARCSAPRASFSALAPPQLVVDFSTVKVDKGRAFAARLREATGCGWVDAPVSGGPPASGAGTLTVMAGGAADDIARIAPADEGRRRALHAHGARRRRARRPR